AVHARLPAPCAARNQRFRRPAARGYPRRLRHVCHRNYGHAPSGAEAVRGAGMINANELIGSHDVLFVTIDTWRYDVARDCLAQGRTPNLAAVLPNGVWEERHSPGNFPSAAHHAFFAGFLPTPSTPGKHPRLFAVRFPGSETIAAHTCVFDA